MQTPSNASSGQYRERIAVSIVGAYAVFAAIWAVAKAADGFPTVAVAAYALIAAIAGWSMWGGGRAAAAWRDWLPFFALPVLYGLVPSTAGVREFHDAAVQGWDRSLFGVDAARVLAGGMPWAIVGFVLHLAYLSYYAIIYFPALLLWWSGRRRAFELTLGAFSIAMVASMVGFLLFPVEGPRYAWPPPAGVPDEPARRVALYLLERGSSRGTAFPSSHVAIATAISLSCLSGWRRLGWVVMPTTVLLAVGAVYGGFHYGVDVLAGAVVGVAAWGASRAVNH